MLVKAKYENENGRQKVFTGTHKFQRGNHFGEGLGGKFEASFPQSENYRSIHCFDLNFRPST